MQQQNKVNMSSNNTMSFKNVAEYILKNSDDPLSTQEIAEKALRPEAYMLKECESICKMGYFIYSA